MGGAGVGGGLVDDARVRARRDREEEGGEGDDEETPRHGCARDAPRQPPDDGARGFDARAGDEGATSSGSPRRRSIDAGTRYRKRRLARSTTDSSFV